MNAKLGLLLVGISEEKFSSWPADRSLKLLSEDGRALRRRAVKGVGIEIQRALFVQVARRIDSLAIESDVTDQLILVGNEAEAWLQLDQILSRENISALTTPKATPAPLPKASEPEVIKPVSLWSKFVASFRRAESEPAQAASPGSSLPLSSTEPVAPVLGEQVLLPGDEVKTWHSVIKALEIEPLLEKSTSWRQLGADRAAALLTRAATLFESSVLKGSAVVQVLIDAGGIQSEVPHE